MKIADKILLEEFTKKHSGTKTAVNKWIETMENNEFANHNELRALFPKADYVGNQRYVFDIKGNRYRFVVLVVFIFGKMQIRFCGTHKEYDRIKNIENI